MKIFNNVAGRKTGKSKFNLSHEKKMSLNMGDLIPVLLQEIVPGDVFRVNTEIFMRFAPMIAPVMHQINVYTHYFFVPNRLVWSEWEDFVTGGRQGDLDPAVPSFGISNTTAPLMQKGSLADYFGVPIPPEGNVAQAGNISSIPFRAYQKIYNEYYQDQNLQTEIDLPTDGGNISDLTMEETVKLRKRAWEKDYFTSALPWSQRGGESTVPMEIEYADTSIVKTTDGADGEATANLEIANGGQLNISGGEIHTGRIENLTGVGVTINDLRKSVRLQEWLERTARAGSRYIEQILSHFGVHSSDARLQRPEYLGGGKNPVTISEVLSTYGGAPEGQPEVPQGNMAGHGISVGRNHGFKKRFEEHGYVIGIMSVLPKTSYQDGIEKHWLRKSKFDYYWPEFAQLGEQEIQNQELFLDYENAEANREGTFGYQARYADYKYKNSTVHGDFRDTLNFWHMGRQFTELPVLNEEFIQSDPDPRIFAVTDEEEDKLYCQIYNKVDAIRPMPYFNNPTL